MRSCVHPWRKSALVTVLLSSQITLPTTHTRQCGHVGVQCVEGFYMLYLSLSLTIPYGVDRALLLFHFANVMMEVLFTIINMTYRYRYALESV